MIDTCLMICSILPALQTPSAYACVQASVVCPLHPRPQGLVYFHGGQADLALNPAQPHQVTKFYEA